MDTQIGAGTPVRLVPQKNGLQLENSNLTLVKRDAQGSWSTVDHFDGPVSSAELDSSYGVWVDKKIVSNHWWGQRVERPQDGQVQNDEVMEFKNARGFQTSVITHWRQDYDDIFRCEDAKIVPAEGGGYQVESDWSHHTTYNGLYGLYSVHASPMAPASVVKECSQYQNYEMSWDVPLRELEER